MWMRLQPNTLLTPPALLTYGSKSDTFNFDSANQAMKNYLRTTLSV